jgi:thiaminase/transcriptional activator TenA
VTRWSDGLRAAAADVWAAQHAHPFVRGVGEGSLDPDRFRHYVAQDYLFLVDYARLLALGCARAPGLAEMARFAAVAQGILGTEMSLHRAFAAEWGISPEELEQARPTATTRAYVDFLLRIGALGDHAELVAALLPCMWGYHEVGVRLAADGLPADARYAAWVELYAGEEFAELTAWCRGLADDAGADAGPALRARMVEAFVASSRHELAFWDASWRLERPA